MSFHWELVDCKLLRGRRLRAQVCGVANIHRVEIYCIGSRGIIGEFMSISHVVFTPIVMFIEKIGPHPSSFGIPQILTTDQGSLFMSHQVPEFAEFLKIKLLSSSPYYAQTNGQTESSNKTLIKLIKKKIEENPKRWHEVLSEVLWTHRIY
jgi:transposase InsO family protein